MKNLNKFACGLTLAGVVASCVVSAEPTRRQTTPDALARELTDFLRRMEVTGQSIVAVQGWDIACACAPPAQPNGPHPPPPPWKLADAKLTILALQAMVAAYEANKVPTVLPATAEQQR